MSKPTEQTTDLDLAVPILRHHANAEEAADAVKYVIDRLRGPDGRCADRHVAVAVTDLEKAELMLRRAAGQV